METFVPLTKDRRASSMVEKDDRRPFKLPCISFELLS